MTKLPIKLYVFIAFYFVGGLLFAQTEAEYADRVNQKFQGKREVNVSGGRADIVTNEYAIEVELAAHWKNSIGQALWYGLQTNKKPGIVLIMKSINDRKYGIMLQSAIDYAGIGDKIKVWFYPEDFGVSFEEQAAKAASASSFTTSGKAAVNYSRNRNSGVRHNSRCRYFACDNCVACGLGEGKKACGVCGG